jgi:hypothetical protein
MASPHTYILIVLKERALRYQNIGVGASPNCQGIRKAPVRGPFYFGVYYLA